MVRFILACGDIPEGFIPDSFFAHYQTSKGTFMPKWLKPDGTIAPLPTTAEEAGYEPFTAGAVR